jgi:hypothetical protein
MVHGERKWLANEDEILRANYTDRGVAWLMRRLGRTRRAVVGRHHRLGLPSTLPPQWTEAEDDAIRAWYAQRASSKIELQKLADTLGRGRIAVCARAKKLGVTNHKRKTGRKVRRKSTDADDLKRIQRDAARSRIAKYGHPQGALGMKHTDEVKAAQSARSKAMNAKRTPVEKIAIAAKAHKTKLDRYGTAGPAAFGANPYSRARRGVRPDIGEMFFRSRWEANYARYLNFLKSHGKIKAWRYEAVVFRFGKLYRGCTTYTPDFEVTMPDGRVVFHEVKGWMDNKSKTKLRRMKKYHPTIEVEIIGEARYRAIEKTASGLIPKWERKG